MRSIICLFLVLKLLVGPHAQEVLTNFERDGSLSHIFMQEYEGNKVIIEFTVDNDILLYHLQDGLPELKSRSAGDFYDPSGSYSDLTFVGKYLVHAGEQLTVFDIMIGDRMDYNGPNGTTPYRVRKRYDDLIDVGYRKADQLVGDIFRIDLGDETSTLVEEGQNVLYLSERLEIITDRPANPQFVTWTIRDRIWGQSWEIQHQDQIFNRSYFSDSLLFYSEGKRTMYAAAPDWIPQVVVDWEALGLGTFRHYDLGTHYASLFGPIAPDMFRLVLLDKSSSQISHHDIYGSSYRFGLEALEKGGDYLAVFGDDIFDLTTGQTFSYVNGSEANQTTLLADSLLVVVTSSPQVRVIGSTDEHWSPQEEVWRSGRYPTQYLELEDEWLIGFPAAEDGRQKLWSLPKDVSSNVELSPWLYLEQSSTGLLEDAKLVQLESSIALVEQNIYAVIEDEVTQLNDQKPMQAALGNSESYLVYDDTLFWAEQQVDGLAFHWYSADVSGLYVTADIDPSIVRAYAVADGHVYVSTDTMGGSLTVLDAATGEVLESWINDDLSPDLAQINGTIYCLYRDSLAVLQPDGILPLLPVYSAYSSLTTVTDHVVSVDGRSFYLQRDGIYDVTNPLDVHLSAEMTEPGYLWSFDENLAIASSPSLDEQRLFDGYLLTDPIDQALGRLSFLSGTLFSSYVAYVDASVDPYIPRLYDMQLDELIDMPSSLDGTAIFEAFVLQGDTILLVSGSQEISFYHVYDNWSVFDERASFTTQERESFFDFHRYADDAVMHLGEEVYVVDEDLNFVALDKMIGDVADQDIVNVGDYFYLIGIDPDVGRQVFRISTPSSRIVSSSTLLEELPSPIKVYPNPTADHLEVSLGDDSSFVYEIYNSSGNLALHGASMGLISVVDLPVGLYTLHVSLQGRVLSAPFVKL